VTARPAVGSSREEPANRTAHGGVTPGMTPRRAGLVSFVLACSSLPALAGTASAAPPTCGGEVATIVGTAGADVLTGTEGRDVIVGLAGPDRIDGGGGDDVLCGGDGADRLAGGEGDDRLLAGAALRVVDRGGDGFRPDVLEGGPGDDLLDIGPREPGSDSEDVTGTLRFDRSPQRVRVELGRGWASGDGEDTVVPRPGTRVLGSAFDDRLVGGVHGDELYGGLGADVLAGGDGVDHLYGDPASDGDPGQSGQDDRLVGGAGKDVLVGARGSDSLAGGPGTDALQTSGAGAQTVLGGADQDFLTVTLNPAAGWLIDGGGAALDSLLLQLPEQRPGRQADVEVDLGLQRLALDLETIGRVTGVRRVSAGSAMDLEFVGTAADEVVFAFLTGSLRASMRGGDDEATGGRRVDLVDGGTGRDEASGLGGQDRCTDVEVRRSCELG